MSRVKRGLQIFLLCLVVASFIYFSRKVDFQAVWTVLKLASLPFVVLSLLTLVILWICRIYVLKSLLEIKKKVSWALVSRVHLIGAMADQFIPARGGNVVRWGLLSFSFVREKGFVFTVLGGTLFIEGFALLILFVVASIIFGFLREQSSREAQGLVVIFLMSVSLLFVFADKVKSLIPEAWLMKISPLRAAFEIRKAASTRHLVSWLFVSFVGWISQILFIIFLAEALQIPMDFQSSLILLIFINLAVVIPVIPTNAGTLHLVIVTWLTKMGISQNAALAYAIAYHFLQVAPVLLVGAWLSMTGKKDLSGAEIDSALFKTQPIDPQ